MADHLQRCLSIYLPWKLIFFTVKQLDTVEKDEEGIPEIMLNRSMSLQQAFSYQSLFQKC